MAYPILYKATETNFEHLGVSVLSDASECYVTRERNGIYILEFNYPINGKDVEKMKEGMIIRCDAGYRAKNQRFIISQITKTKDNFKIYCQHISQVKTSMNAIRPDVTVTSVGAMGALSAWKESLLDSKEEFFVQSDITTVNSTAWKVETIENARDALGGKAGSILDVWGGEFEFDNLNIILHKNMGVENPTIIAYGKNLVDLEQEQSILETYTSVFPFKKYTDDNNRDQLLVLPEVLIDSPHVNNFTHRRILKVDFSSDEHLSTVEQLRSKTKTYIKSNNVGVPKVNLKLNYQDLSKVEGIFDTPALEVVDLCDRLKVYYSELGILNENAKVIKVVWDVILEENHELEVGDSKSSFGDSTSAKIESLQAQNDSITARINAMIAEREAAFDRYFNEKSKVIEDKVKGGYEKALLSSEEKLRKMGEAFDEKLAPIRNQVSTTVENYNRQFQATNLEISKNRVEATKQIQALTDRVNNIQDISNNETVRELRGLVNGATSKVTELETSITREFTAVKKKNEDSLNAVKAEFTKGVNGLTSKITSLEEYKNQDGSRTESLKQWIQRDTASQLSRERTEINKIIDNKGFVKNTEFSNKFNENAQGINRQLSALETYKNQDGSRVANMQIWVQNNTANQLTAERRNIEKWVNDKGYVTTSVVENKVQETANSFSREISNVRNSIPTSLGGRNYILNSGEPLKKEGHSWGGDWEIRTHSYYYNGNKKIMCLPNSTTRENFIVSPRFKLKRNTDYVISFKGFASWNTINMDVYVLGRRNNENNDFTIPTLVVESRRLSPERLETVKNIKFNSGQMDEAYLRFDNNGSNDNQQAVLFIAEVKLEEGIISTDWTPAPEDSQQSINELNTWKQTTTETLNTVSSGLNDTVKHSQLRVGADKIDFGSNQVFDGRNLASMLSVSPESIQAITNKLVITPANENLVKNEFRELISTEWRDYLITPDIYEKLSDGTEFYFKARFFCNGLSKQRIGIHIYVTYTDNSQSWGFTEIFPSNRYVWNEEKSATLKFEKTAGKEVKYYKLGIHQAAVDNFSNWAIRDLVIYQKKSAELIVDGSIEGRQIKTQTLETGHHKAGSITSEIIAANAVRAKHILIDDGLINNLVTHNAFISKLWAQDAFIRSLKTVKISSTQLDTDWLSAYTGDIGGFRIGKNPNQPGDFWLTGSNNFNCGLNPGHNIGTRGAQIWAAWGYNWNQAGPNAWWVDGQGRMNCKGSATFYGGLHVFNSRLDTHGQDIQGDANSAGAKTTVIWWSQIDRVKSSVSDKRFKTNIKPTKVKAVDLLNKIEMVEFNWKKDNKFEKIGAIAQQVQSVEESLVVKDMDSKQSHSDYLRISYYDAIPYLIKAVQELSEENNKLKNKLEELING